MDYRPLSTRYYADIEISTGDDGSALKYKLFRGLSIPIPSHISDLMRTYDEDFIKSARSGAEDRVYILQVKEAVDDYLEDTQYRIVKKLDNSSLKQLKTYEAMVFDTMLDKLNSVNINSRVLEIVTNYKIRLNENSTEIK